MCVAVNDRKVDGLRVDSAFILDVRIIAAEVKKSDSVAIEVEAARAAVEKDAVARTTGTEAVGVV